MTQLTTFVYYKFIAKLYSLVESLKHFVNPQENYWKQKCIELQEQNKQLQLELSQEKESRAIVDKLYINAKARIDEREMQLEEFLSKELEMCQGCQKFTSQPEFIEYMDEDETEDVIDFEERARETITQLLVSNSTAMSICISLGDLAVKTDATDLDCVRIALVSIVDYLKLNNRLNEEDEIHLLYDIGVVSVGSILKYLEKNKKDTLEWLKPRSNYKYQTAIEECPISQVQISWSPIRNKREYYIPTDDDIETETIIYDQEEELEIEFVNE
ncbi:hypothetical protein HK103_000926 [Boothiomyces macroporosus]|uniref:Uncharacterized protein n=1 Tax=Boothiomyces macroporosus TaxID=261099 RepID=A0AAD5Y5Q6_9FUNG|nr:hypothetical protein HK103_000926 [Boothiomyces macroporosus]